MSNPQFADIEANLYQKYKNEKDIVFLALHRGETRDIYQRFQEQANLSFPVLRDSANTVYMKYRGGIAPKFAPFPRDIIIDKNGRVIYYAKEYHPDKIDRVLQQQLVNTSVNHTLETTLDQCSLFPNYPNPFNQSTVIPFQIKSSDMSLKIYNLRGQLVKILAEGNRVAGLHQAQWDGTNDLNVLQPTGVYFVILTDGIQKKQRAILFVK